jgi:hypothetical protein
MTGFELFIYQPLFDPAALNSPRSAAPYYARATIYSCEGFEQIMKLLSHTSPGGGEFLFPRSPRFALVCMKAHVY